jgi:hypothetical protein
MLQRYWRAETGIFLVLWLVLLVGGRSRLFRDPGTFWHTVVGQRILATHQLPDTDSYSYPFQGEPWIASEWLGECTLGVLHDFGGFDTLLLAAATLLAGLHTWIASRLLRAGLHWSLTMTLVALAMAAANSNWHVRPHLATMLFLAVTFALLCDFEKGRIGIGRLMALVPLFALWSNIHGGMLGGVGTLGLAVSYWGVSWALGRGLAHIRGRHLLSLGGLVVACALTALINPYGVELPAVWFRILDSADLPKIITEHAPLNPASLDGLSVLVYGAVYGVALLGLRPQWPRVAWLLPLVWLVLAWSRIRHAPLFAVTALLALAEVLPHTRWAAWLAQPGRDLFHSPPTALPARSAWRAALLPASAVVLALFLQSASVRVPIIGRDWARLDPGYWPVDLLPALCEEARHHPAGTPIFNEVLDGGFLIYYTPTFQVFCDDRCELYGGEWLKALLDAEWSDTDQRLRFLSRQRVPFRLAVTRTGSGFDQHFRHTDEWVVVRQTETATLYRRRELHGGRLSPSAAHLVKR